MIIQTNETVHTLVSNHLGGEDLIFPWEKYEFWLKSSKSFWHGFLFPKGTCMIDNRVHLYVRERDRYGSFNPYPNG